MLLARHERWIEFHIMLFREIRNDQRSIAKCFPRKSSGLNDRHTNWDKNLEILEKYTNCLIGRYGVPNFWEKKTNELAFTNSYFRIFGRNFGQNDDCNFSSLNRLNSIYSWACTFGVEKVKNFRTQEHGSIVVLVFSEEYQLSIYVRKFLERCT